jgi:hypothetical protein
MEAIMLTLMTKTAKLSDFRSPTPKILYGDMLAKVRNIQASILEHGLLNPLVVSQSGNRLMVIDGRKRLAALRRMQFEGTLPRSLVRIPYIIVDEPSKTKAGSDMALLPNRDQYEAVKTLRRRGYDEQDIAARLHCSRRIIADILKVDRLSDNLKAAYMNDALSLAQVRAFATIPNMDAQDSLLIALGPFAKEQDILNAISRGETILNIDEDNVIVLPSRASRAFAFGHAA